MNDLIDTTEMYLKSIIELEEQSIVPLRARIAERLDHSGPTVSQTVARMERDGLLHVSNDRHLELTAEGRRIATEVMRKHRLAERLLADVVGLEWELVHDEACRWEHVMSEQVERKLVTLLPEIASGPYGNPIPGLDVIGGKLNNGTEVVDLATAVARDGAKELRIAWLAEPLQVDIHLLQQFQVAGVLPESDVEISRNGEYITVQVPGAQDVLDLPLDTASHVFAYKK
ncbi:MAG: metal-dependent transcriptional regulator [Brevibacterium aurantiacum]|uniref:Iron (Metal) dependent repressor, DtxR family n=1 Tax=Brevibacterium aurantiacum TaxID=273384 RepID=A0A2A3ZR88_BREAU|nr:MULTISPECIES: metal-dependent transcriptional regulator [Brevibacterium]MDN5552155.1 metal-dependent transcriptional regulator [Brevibacterium sp.]AZL06854.1 metal-dependent transcriptional regulator [Brevibacterium aurantiacum]AZL10398.1 metal-dependent transcriptional regulator [Brevibacterium aurantiacum]AZL14081.1 metal-dependent transcriptional regulator [Brevibacterium aurantiacum]AZT94618.1 metal-dependent transcriptional regulator [Brevibacterium aurantiacum]